MLSKSYQNKIRSIIYPIVSNDKAGIFVFGSAAKSKRFGDVDLAIKGRISQKKIRKIKTALEDSNLPYFFDVVDLRRCSKSFLANILDNKIIWLIKH